MKTGRTDWFAQPGLLREESCYDVNGSIRAVVLPISFPVINGSVNEICHWILVSEATSVHLRVPIFAPVNFCYSTSVHVEVVIKMADS